MGGADSDLLSAERNGHHSNPGHDSAKEFSTMAPPSGRRKPPAKLTPSAISTGFSLQFRHKAANHGIFATTGVASKNACLDTYPEVPLREARQAHDEAVRFLFRSFQPFPLANPLGI
jgi:hypothetical protein